MHPIIILLDDLVVDVGVILKNGLKGPGAFRLVMSTTPGGREAPCFLFIIHCTEDKQLIYIFLFCFFFKYLQYFYFLNMLGLLN